MLEHALGAFKEMLFQLGRLQLANGFDEADAYAVGWEFISRALDTLALLNRTYFNKGWGANHAQTLELSYRPDNLEQLLREILHPSASNKRLPPATQLADEIGELLLVAQRFETDYADHESDFKDFYPHIFEYKNKVLSACRQGEEIAAGYAAYQLQDLFVRLLSKSEYGYFGSESNLPSEYGAAYDEAGFPNLLPAAADADLDTLARQAAELDVLAQDWLLRHGVGLNILESEDELRRFLSQRDPVSK